MTSRTTERWNGPARQHDGCIVSFESASGAELTLHRTGPLKQALRGACADALALDPTFRVTCYSTPQTIYRDLDGGHMDFDNNAGRRTESQRPEAAALGVAGLSHMGHPRLGIGRGDTEARQRRRARGQRLRP